MDDLEVNERVRIPGRELTWSAVRASGPGGQNVNKVASKVDLRFAFEDSAALDPLTRTRLRRLAHGKLDQEGALRVTSQRTRDQARNLEDARLKLAALIRQALERPKPRRKTKPTRGGNERRLKAKRQNAERKANRRRGFD